MQVAGSGGGKLWLLDGMGGTREDTPRSAGCVPAGSSLFASLCLIHFFLSSRIAGGQLSEVGLRILIFSEFPREVRLRKVGAGKLR